MMGVAEKTTNEKGGMVRERRPLTCIQPVIVIHTLTEGF
jgi:hypothetical protein